MCSWYLVKGYGVVATSQIRKGDFILEYVGEVLDNKTVSERAQHRPEGYSYVFYIDKTTR